MYLKPWLFSIPRYLWVVKKLWFVPKFFFAYTSQLKYCAFKQLLDWPDVKHTMFACLITYNKLWYYKLWYARVPKDHNQFRCFDSEKVWSSFHKARTHLSYPTYPPPLRTYVLSHQSPLSPRFSLLSPPLVIPDPHLPLSCRIGGSLHMRGCLGGKFGSTVWPAMLRSVIHSSVRSF